MFINRCAGGSECGGERVSRHSRVKRAILKLPPALLLEDAADLPLELRNAIDDSPPDKQCVDAKICVNQFIPHPCHLTPGNGRISLPDGQRDLFCRLTDDLEFPDDGALGPVVTQELIIGHACGTQSSRAQQQGPRDREYAISCDKEVPGNLPADLRAECRLRHDVHA